MEERESKNKIQCIVDEGIVLNRRDMVRILRDLGQVRYEDQLDGAVLKRGEGFVAGVYANENASTIIVNKRLYLNVNSFDFMRLVLLDDDETAIDLVDDQRTIRLIPMSEGMHERQTFATESAVIPNQGTLERMLGVEPGESLFEEDLDESDEM
jgi:hypothetical protein